MHFSWKPEFGPSNFDIFEIFFQAIYFSSSFFFYLFVSATSMAAFGKGTQNHHPTSNIAKELGKGGKKPKGTQGVHTLYRLEFFAFFFCVFHFPVILHCHIEEPSRTAKALKSYLSFSGIRPSQGTSNNKHSYAFHHKKKKRD